MALNIEYGMPTQNNLDLQLPRASSHGISIVPLLTPPLYSWVRECETWMRDMSLVRVLADHDTAAYVVRFRLLRGAGSQGHTTLTHHAHLGRLFAVP